MYTEVVPRSTAFEEKIEGLRTGYLQVTCYSKSRLHSSDLLEFQVHFDSKFFLSRDLVAWVDEIALRAVLFIDPKLRQTN